MPREKGYSRAIPLRWSPAFYPKAIPSEAAPQKEWEAGLQAIATVRQWLNEEERRAQPLLVLVDGAFEKVQAFWEGLPEGVIVLGRTARNRVFYELPPTERKVGRPRQYGKRAPTPAQWLQQRKGWQKRTIGVRGREISEEFKMLTRVSLQRRTFLCRDAALRPTRKRSAQADCRPKALRGAPRRRICPLRKMPLK